MSRLSVGVIVFLACVGACVSGTLLHGHDGGWESNSGGSNYLLRLCDSDRMESADCASVIGSKWGAFDFYAGSRRISVPLSLVGLIHFVAIVIWFSMLGRMPASATRLWTATLAYLGCAVLASVFLLGLMAFSLPEWCPPCVAAHAINLGIFAVAIALWSTVRRESTLASECDSWNDRRVFPAWARARVATWAVVAAMASGVSFWAYFDATLEVRRQWRKLSDIRHTIDELRNDPAFVLREFYAQPVVDIPEIESRGEGFSVDGPRLVIFTDYACAGCRCFESRRPEMIDSAFATGLNIEYRHAPAVSDRGVGSDALRACRASEAARMQGGDEAFERIHRMLFVNPKNPAARDFGKLAFHAGLDAKRVLRDMEGSEARDRVRADVALSKRLGITETPALFLNGRRVPVLCVNSPVFWSAIGAELGEQHANAGDADVYAGARP